MLAKFLNARDTRAAEPCFCFLHTPRWFPQHPTRTLRYVTAQVAYDACSAHESREDTKWSGIRNRKYLPSLPPPVSLNITTQWPSSVFAPTPHPETPNKNHANFSPPISFIKIPTPDALIYHTPDLGRSS